jgi:hypothetical protein
MRHVLQQKIVPRERDADAAHEQLRAQQCFNAQTCALYPFPAGIHCIMSRWHGGKK